MKKKLIFFMALIMFPTLVMADAGPPQLIGYEALISNKNGVEYYDYDYIEGDGEFKIEGNLKYNDLIRVFYEEKINGKMYAQFDYYVNDEESISGYVLLSEIKLKNDTYKLNKDDIVEVDKYQTKAKVLNKDGIYLRKGPAEAYDKITKIPYDAEMKASFRDMDEIWIYVDYNGTKGWVDSSNESIGYFNTDPILICDNEEFVSGDVVISEIKPNTIITDGYYITKYFNDNHSYQNKYIYFEYNKKKGHIKYYNGDNVIHYNEAKELTVKNLDVNLYETRSIKSKLITNIPADTVLKYNYISETEYSFARYEHCVYTEYNGKKGWVIIGDMFNNVYEGVPLETSVNFYTMFKTDVLNKNGEKIGEIPASSKISTSYIDLATCDDSSTCKVYVKYNDITGYVLKNELADDMEAEYFEPYIAEEYDKIKLYETLDTNPKVLIEEKYSPKKMKKTIATLCVRYYSDKEENYYLDYVEYNGKKGWIITKYSYDDETYKAKYTNVDFKKDFSKFLNTLYDEEKRYRDEWDEENNDENSKNEKEIKTNDRRNVDYINNKATENVDVVPEKAGLNGMQIVILCVFGAAIIGVTTLVIILLCSRKKKEK